MEKSVVREHHTAGTLECINATTTIAIKMVKKANKTPAMAQHI